VATTRKPAPKKKPAKKTTLSKTQGRKTSTASTKTKRPAHRPAGTPDIWTPEYIAMVSGELETYIRATKCPMVSEFCYMHGVHKQRLSEITELASLRDWLICKKEAYLEKAGLALTKEHGGRASFIIFSLKQLGWKDKTEVEHSGNIQFPKVELFLMGVDKPKVEEPDV
jgi:hypothetical protein